MRSRGLWIFLLLAAATIAWLGQDSILGFLPRLPENTRARTINTRALVATLTPNPVVAAQAGNASEAAQPTPTPDNVVRYEVVAGDTLTSIALAFGVELATLINANNLYDPGTLRVGQELRIPLPTTAPGGVTATPTAVPANVYLVRAGDTLASIARAYDTNATVLQEMNRLADPNQLSVGQRLLVPTVAPSPPPSPTPQPPAAAGAPDAPVNPAADSPPPAAPSGNGPVVLDPDQLSNAPTSQRPAAPAAGATPTPDSNCIDGRKQALIWGPVFCLPGGWALSEAGPPRRSVFLIHDEFDGSRTVYGIIRPSGWGNPPLTLAMRTAKSAVQEQLAGYIPGGITRPQEWTPVQAFDLAETRGQMSEAATTFADSGEPARLRVIVFNHDNQRWLVVMAAPESLWQSYSDTVFTMITRSLRIL